MIEDNDNISDDEDENRKKAKVGSFQSMGLEKELMWGISRMGYKVPTPVQRKALPIVLAGMDMVCMARTGSGKTCVFLLPLMQKVKKHDPTSGVRGVVLSPTRELAMQTFKFAKDIAKFTDLRVIAIVGGDPIEAQFEALASRPDVIIATPGRLMHHLREISTFKLKHVEYLVFDEADRLFEMGFAEQLNEIVKECPEGRQTLLFSATLPKMLIQFTRAGLRDPQLIRLDTDIKMSDELRLAFFSLRSNEKVAALLYLVRTLIPPNQLSIIFTATRHHSEFLHALFKKVSITSTLVYGSMDQDARSANLTSFRRGEVSYLIVTDLAARGIDVPLLDNVINFHFPQAPKLFVHRCGRAARQGRIGFAFSLVEPEEVAFMLDVHMLLGKELDASYNQKKDEITGITEEEVGDTFDADDNNINHSNGDNATVKTSSFSTSSTQVNDQCSYTLETMTPDLVQTGLLPQDVLDEENEYFKRALANDDNLAMLWKISENGMKQYRRTRSEASKEGVKMTKSIVKGNVIRSLHPLIVGCDPTRCSPQVVEKQEFVRMLQKFRPAQTVFESGIGLGTGSQAVKAKAKPGSKEYHGVEVMKAFRKVTAPSLERNKIKIRELIAKNKAEKDAARRLEEEGGGLLGGGREGGVGGGEGMKLGLGNAGWNRDDSMDDGDNDFGIGETDSIIGDNHSVCSYNTQSTEKPRLNIAEKKKMKKQGMTNDQMRKLAMRRAFTSKIVAENTRGVNTNGMNIGVLEGLEMDGGAGSSFKDSKFFMNYGNEDEQQRMQEDLMQPQSGLRDLEMQSVTKLESAYLDLQPDTALDLNKKRRLLRWDAKKRKFVKQSLEEMSNVKGLKRLRTESGAPIKQSKIPQGEMYAKWKKRTRNEVSLPGQGDAADDRPRPNMKVNRNVKDELLTSKDQHKIKKAKENNKLKNTKKDKRSQIENKGRKAKATKAAAGKYSGTKAGQRKVKAILRY